mmetsp:Transcript_32616/g.85398  ORF Transcript_32616/g.85398 Transcript_32616/m.85398 type:complete len:275 (+) Transcript_32616:2153-2977(+)
MRHLVQQDGHKRHPRRSLGVQEDRAKREAVGEVVRKVGSEIEVSSHLDVTTCRRTRGVPLFLVGLTSLPTLVVTAGWLGGRGGVGVAAVGVPVPAILHAPHQLFHNHKGQNSAEGPQPNDHLLCMVMPVVTVAVAVVMVVPTARVVVRIHGVGDQVQQRVSQQPAGRKSKQHLQERLGGLGVREWDEQQHDGRGCRDDDGGGDGLAPDDGLGVCEELPEKGVDVGVQVPWVHRRFQHLVVMPTATTVVVVVVVAVAVALVCREVGRVVVVRVRV